MRYKGTGVNCRACAFEKSRTIINNKSKTDKEIGKSIEFESFKYLQNLLQHSYEVRRTNECCIADCIVRPIGCEKDEWLMIQLKARTKPLYGLYSFNIDGNDYSKCVMAMMCLPEEKLWIMDGALTTHLKANLNIGVGESKYNQYMVSSNHEDVIHSFYKTKQLFPQSVCITPITKNCQIEHKYRSKRETIANLTFDYPDIEGQAHDFKINHYKIQEKVCSINKLKNNACVSLHRRQAKTQYRSYFKGDNDFYWIWLNDTDRFYVIPEDALLSRKMIDCETFTSDKRISFTLNYDNETAWYNEYKFDLNTLDTTKLMKMLKI